MVNRIRVLVVDDESLGRRAVCRLLSADTRFEVVGEASNGVDALRLIAELKPDVAFLDLAMPGLGGMDVATRCPEPRPALVFVTAHDRFALEAFDNEALDYVLKPIDPLRFRLTLDRIAARRDPSDTQKRPPGKSITLRSAGRTVVFDVDDLVLAEAQGNYVELHFERSLERVRLTMTRLLELLDGTRVVRVHRAFAVHLDQIRRLEVTDGSHGAQLVLKSGTQVPVGRTYREDVQRALDPAE